MRSAKNIFFLLIQIAMFQYNNPFFIKVYIVRKFIYIMFGKGECLKLSQTALRVYYRFYYSGNKI